MTFRDPQSHLIQGELSSENLVSTKVPLVVRQDDLGNLVRGKRNVFVSSYLGDSSFHYDDLIDSFAVFQYHANHLVPHAGFGFRCQFRRPFCW